MISVNVLVLYVHWTPNPAKFNPARDSVSVTVVAGLQDSPHHAYFAVFDGHGGLEAAIYTSQHLHYNMVHDTSFLTSTDTAMHDSFCKTDNQFLEKAKAEVRRQNWATFDFEYSTVQYSLYWLRQAVCGL